MSVNNCPSEIDSFVNLCVSKCSATSQDHTERFVVVAIAIVVVRIEHARIGTIIVIAPTFEERISRVHEVRVVQFSPNYISGCLRTPFNLSFKALPVF